MNFKLTLSYDGTDFHGWQTQPGLRTVQETLADAVFALTRERVRANASGRTDTGVHAVGQVVNCNPTVKPAWHRETLMPRAAQRSFASRTT